MPEGVTKAQSVLCMFVCVSRLSWAWLCTAFTNVRRKFLVSCYGHSYGARFLSWRLSKGQTAKALPTKGGARLCVLLAYEKQGNTCGAGDTGTLHALMAAPAFEGRVKTTVLSPARFPSPKNYTRYLLPLTMKFRAVAAHLLKDNRGHPS